MNDMRPVKFVYNLICGYVAFFQNNLVTVVTYCALLNEISKKSFNKKAFEELEWEVKIGPNIVWR